MGNNLFGANISGKIAAALGARLLTGTLRKITPGAINPSNITAGVTDTVTTHTFAGIFDQFSSRRMGSTAIAEGARVVLFLADTIQGGVTPALNDEVVLEGETVKIVGPVLRDPDAASFIAEVAT